MTMVVAAALLAKVDGAGHECMEALNKLRMSSPLFSPTDGVDAACPRACTKDDDDQGSLRKCKENEEERNHESCGTDRCADFIKSISQASIDAFDTSMKTVLDGACKD